MVPRELAEDEWVLLAETDRLVGAEAANFLDTIHLSPRGARLVAEQCAAVLQDVMGSERKVDAALATDAARPEQRGEE